jgi:hypothetical protein
MGQIHDKHPRHDRLHADGVHPFHHQRVIQAAVAGKIDCEEFTREMNPKESPLLHLEMARIYRVKVTELARALQQPEGRCEATEALRGLVDAIVLTPDQAREALQIELRGNLAAMLDATVQTKRSPESDDLSLHVSLVAGACNQRYLQLWSVAA